MEAIQLISRAYFTQTWNMVVHIIMESIAELLILAYLVSLLWTWFALREERKPLSEHSLIIRGVKM